MTLQLKTSHALYANITACIGVQSDNAIVDFKGAQTLTVDAAVVMGSGTFGAHFRTSVVSTNAKGVAMSPGIPTKTVAGGGVGTTFVVINAGNSRTSRGGVFETTSVVGPGVYTGDAVGITGSAAVYPVNLGTTDVIGTGAHSFAVGVNGTSGGKTWVNGALEATTAVNVGSATDSATNYAKYIGGSSTGGFGGFAADYVWVVQFNKFLSDAEVADLHASLGANNAFGLVNSSGATINCTPGDAAASGPTAAITQSGSATIAGIVGNAAAGGSTVSVDTYIVTDTAINNTRTGNIVSQAVSYTWWPSGRIGSIAGITAVDGAGTIGADGRLVTTIVRAPGLLQYAKRNAGASTDEVFYEAF